MRAADKSLPWDWFLVNCDKLLLTLTSWLCIIPAFAAWERGDWLAIALITSGGLCASLHHAVEHRFGFPAFCDVGPERFRAATLYAMRVSEALIFCHNISVSVWNDYGPAALLVVGLAVSSEYAAVEPYFSPRQRRVWRFIAQWAHQVGAAALLTHIVMRQ